MSRQGLGVGTLTRCTAWVGERQLDRQADIAGSVRTPVASTVQTPDPLTPFFSPANFKSRLHPPASRPLYSTPQQTSRAVIFLEATSPSWKQLYPWGNTSFPLLRNIPCNCSISCISTFPGTRHNPSRHSFILCSCQHIVCSAAFCKLAYYRRVLFQMSPLVQQALKREKGRKRRRMAIQPAWLTVLAGGDPLHVLRAIVRRPSLKQRRYCATSWERCRQELNDALHCFINVIFTAAQR